MQAAVAAALHLGQGSVQAVLEVAVRVQADQRLPEQLTLALAAVDQETRQLSQAARVALVS